MATYDDNNWIQILKSLDLNAKDYSYAKLFLAGKDAAYRRVILDDDKDASKNIILSALGESSTSLPSPGCTCIG